MPAKLSHEGSHYTRTGLALWIALNGYRGNLAWPVPYPPRHSGNAPTASHELSAIKAQWGQGLSPCPVCSCCQALRRDRGGKPEGLASPGKAELREARTLASLASSTTVPTWNLMS